MGKVTNGKFVSVDYTGTLENGDVFDSSQGRQPLELQMGAGQMIKGFESALLHMALNEKKSITLTPEEAYGQRDEELTRTFAREDVPDGMDPQEGQTVALSAPDGQRIPARIAVVDDQKVVVDLNHPLAGATLHFDIEVVAISDAPTQQTGCGCSGDCSPGGCESDGCGGDGCGHHGK